MKMQRDFTESIKKTVEDGHIVIGLSGGPDSVCLFHMFVSLRDELSLSLSAVHVNHQFRPGAAEKDEAYVKELCAKYDVPCYTNTFDVNSLAQEWGMTSEEAGRKVRYDAFCKEAERVYSAGEFPKDKIKIAVAHNKNDQAETVLLRLLRGTGSDGLAGIPKTRELDGFTIIRPLLDVDRTDIENYCAKNDLNPQIDHTNAESIYKRNKIRLELIPYLEKEYNPNITDALVRLSRAATEDKEYFAKLANEFIEENLRDEKYVAIKILQFFDKSVRVRVIKKIFAELGLESDITEKHIESAEALLTAGTGKTVEFPGGYGIRTVYNDFEFFAPEKKDFKLGTLNRRTVPIGEWDGEGVAFDVDKLKEVPELRMRKSGDYIKIENGTKKLKDYFIDKKIPREERDVTPVICVGNEVLWIVGHRISAGYKVDENTENVCIIEYKA